MIRLTLSACAMAVAAAVAPTRGTAPMKWTATLAPQGSSKIAGTATVAPDGASKMTVTVSITGGDPNATYPWHVHTGKCTAGPVYGPGSAYKPIKADASGAGTVTVTVPVASPESGDYHVNVHKSPSDMGTIVSCGELTMAM
ncbi:MAG TPA: hypothetical protein VNW46_13875 [Gemmatimonadaceae bacterium]|nr:hypothetical protein [Gemmatimonadaceae bacterium]